MNHLIKTHPPQHSSETPAAGLARLRQEVKHMMANRSSLDAAWRHLDVNRSNSVSASEWQSWAKSRWSFVSNAVLTQSYQRTLASACSHLPESEARQSSGLVDYSHFELLVQTLPICCEAEALFVACDADNDRRVSLSELRTHAKAHGLNLNADQQKNAADLFGSGVRFSGFCDWYFQQRGGDTAQEIAAV
jgi:hypothetical protein